MKRQIIYFSLMALLMMTTVVSCITDPYYSGYSYDESSSYSNGTQNTVHNQKHRTIILDGKEYSGSDEVWGDVVSWVCTDRYDKRSNKVLLEFGYFTSSLAEMMNFGFVLFDGTNKGTIAYYTRAGVNHRWDWLDSTGERLVYAFVIEPDGTGLYYDFSMSTDGTAKPRQLYNTTRR